MSERHRRGSMKSRSCLLAFVALASLALVPSARADFVYDIQDTSYDVHIRFHLPTFEQDVVSQTTFDVAVAPFTVGAFGINGGSGDCIAASLFAGPAPCYALRSPLGDDYEGFSPAFSGPGTFTAFSTTVTITEVPSVPEPSSWPLLSLGVVYVAFLGRRQRLRSTKQP